MNQISLCMIVKNEEASLELCLSAIAPYIDDIIIVDTGSTDSTREIARKYTDKIFDYQWINDFSAARNYALTKARNEYILALDADEITEYIDLEKIHLLISENSKKIGKLLLINEFTRNGIAHQQRERISRLFSKKYYKYEGIIHEQIVPVYRSNFNGSEHYQVPLTVRHTGYGGDQDFRKQKAQRNIHLLEAALRQSPNDPYLLYQTGKSYYMQEDYDSACEFFGQALYADLDPELEYVQDLVESYGYSLINTKQYETALQMLNIYDEFAHSADFIFLIGLILMNNGRFHEAIQEFNKATEKAECKMVGVNDYLALYNIGVIYECLGDLVNAKKYYYKCEKYSLARARLNNL